MTKADKLFKELGYNQAGTKAFGNWDNSLFDYVIFEDDSVDIGDGTPYTIALHLAIHEKLKELKQLTE